MKKKIIRLYDVERQHPVDASSPWMYALMPGGSPEIQIPICYSVETIPVLAQSLSVLLLPGRLDVPVLLVVSFTALIVHRQERQIALSFSLSQIDDLGRC